MWFCCLALNIREWGDTIHFFKVLSPRPRWIQKHEPGPPSLLLSPAEVHKVQLLWISAVPIPRGRLCSPASGPPGPLSLKSTSPLYPLSSHFPFSTFNVTVIYFYSALPQIKLKCGSDLARFLPRPNIHFCFYSGLSFSWVTAALHVHSVWFTALLELGGDVIQGRPISIFTPLAKRSGSDFSMWAKPKQRDSILGLLLEWLTSFSFQTRG